MRFDKLVERYLHHLKESPTSHKWENKNKKFTLSFDLRGDETFYHVTVMKNGEPFKSFRYIGKYSTFGSMEVNTEGLRNFLKDHPHALDSWQKFHHET